MTTFNLTEHDLLKAYDYPFPIEEGAIHDLEGIKHWLLATTVMSASRAEDSADITMISVERSRWVATAAGAMIDRAVAERQAIEILDEGGAATLRKANAARLGQFVDGILASPPVCDVAQVSPPRQLTGIPGVVVLVIPPFVVPPPVPPKWEEGERLSGHDLLAVGLQFQAAVETANLGATREEFVAAADRLFQAAQERLGKE